MRRNLLLTCTALLVPLLLTACGGEPEPPAEPVSRPVKTLLLQAPEGAAIRNFPGRIVAANRADLSFRVPGKVTEILVNEGDKVQQGQVLARLDPKDYQVALSDRQASFDVAQANFEPSLISSQVPVLPATETPSSIR